MYLYISLLVFLWLFLTPLCLFFPLLFSLSLLLPFLPLFLPSFVPLSPRPSSSLPLPFPPLPSLPLSPSITPSFSPLSTVNIQAFSKKCIERRKEWLTQWLQQRRERRDQGLDESLLYSERMDYISYSDFVNKELILFSNMDNERSIACSVDGEWLANALSVNIAECVSFWMTYSLCCVIYMYM